MKCVLFPLLLLFLALRPSLPCPRVTRAFIIFRHGHRNPLAFYPTHPKYGVSKSEFAYGALSEVSFLQRYSYYL